MNSIIFTGGKFPSKEKTKHFLTSLEDKQKIVIVADSGLDAAMSYNIKPDYFLGDMDSVSLKSIEWLKTNNCIGSTEIFPTDKDFSDTEIALKKAAKLGIKYVTVIGGSGGRLDHLLGIVELFKCEYAPNLWLTEENAVCLIDSKKSPHLSILNSSPKDPISVFPIFRLCHDKNLNDKNCNIYRCKSKGLVWQLDNLDWQNGEFSLSNRQNDSVNKENPVEIYAENGKFIVVAPLSAYISYKKL
ncbi:MAG: thiamine diphosphokinase [Treponema sp.]|jgi:thiamine pyrophosphokinase|nr:thiamine diphosphokinase [Treponema sp.]